MNENGHSFALNPLGGRSALTQSPRPAIFFDVIHAGSQTRMAMMRALLAGAVVSLAVRV